MTKDNFDLLKSKKANYHGKNLKVTIYFKNKLFIANKQVYDNNGEMVIFMNIDKKVASVPISKLCQHKDFSVCNF